MFPTLYREGLQDGNARANIPRNIAIGIMLFEPNSLTFQNKFSYFAFQNLGTVVLQLKKLGIDDLVHFVCIYIVASFCFVFNCVGVFIC